MSGSPAGKPSYRNKPDGKTCKCGRKATHVIGNELQCDTCRNARKAARRSTCGFRRPLVPIFRESEDAVSPGR